MRKAQVEFLVVFAVVVLAVSVIFLVLQRVSIPESQLPAGVAEINKLLKDDIEKSLLAGSLSTIRTVGLQGGYWETPELSVRFGSHDVTYWQYANYSLIPDKSYVELQIERGVRDYIEKNVKVEQFQGKNVQISGVNGVDAIISDDKVVVKLWMPTRMGVFDLEQPFQVEATIPLGRIYKLASEITTKNVENRYVELFTASSILAYHATHDGWKPRVPTMGVLEGCGKSLFKTWSDVRPEMEFLLRGSLASTFTGGRVPRGFAEAFPFIPHAYPVQTNLNVSFYLGEPLDSTSFGMNPAELRVETHRLPFTSYCISPVYAVNYWLLFPTVTELRDQDYRFRFAMHAYVNEYGLGPWDDLDVPYNIIQSQAAWCYASCTAKITVTDSSGPVPDADVLFSGCHLGQTNSSGNLFTLAPCGIGLLEVVESGHETHSSLESSDDLYDKSVHLTGKPTITLNAYIAEFSNSSGNYTLLSVTPNQGTVELGLTKAGKTSSVTLNGTTTTTPHIPAGNVSVGASVTSGDRLLGGFSTSHIFPEQPTTLYVYVPTVTNGVDITDDNITAALATILELTRILKSCGAEPISQSKAFSLQEGCEAT